MYSPCTAELPTMCVPAPLPRDSMQGESIDTHKRSRERRRYDYDLTPKCSPLPGVDCRRVRARGVSRSVPGPPWRMSYNLRVASAPVLDPSLGRDTAVTPGAADGTLT